MAGIRHIDIVVSSLSVSRGFYVELLGLLAWKPLGLVRGERGEDIFYIASPNGASDGALGLRVKQSDEHSVPYDRYAVGMHHIAINADSRAKVLECAKWLRRNGFQIESGPEEYYETSYYAVFFYDPDGLKLEIVHCPD